MTLYRYGDTPGLSDSEPDKRRRAAEEITLALKQNGRYRLVFVCTAEAGRVRPDDVTTIHTVLDAISDDRFPYGIVINKASKKFITNYNMDKDVNQSVRACLNHGHRPTEHIFLYPFDKELEDIDDALVEPQQDFLLFISGMPSQLLPSCRIKTIDVEDFEVKKQRFEFEIAQMKLTRDRLYKQKAQRQKIKIMIFAAGGLALLLVITWLGYSLYYNTVYVDLKPALNITNITKLDRER